MRCNRVDAAQWSDDVRNQATSTSGPSSGVALGDVLEAMKRLLVIDAAVRAA
ncbi:MAG: hypothetical protein WDN69_21785 [Aliidongia sp.]